MDKVNAAGRLGAKVSWRLIELPKFGDLLKGFLTPVEAEKTIPFVIKRVFWVWTGLASSIRGKHAHREVQSIFICVHGSVQCTLDDGHKMAKINLTQPDKGLFVSPLVWHELQYRPDTVVLALASGYHSESEYIRDYDEFRKLVGK